MSRTFAGGVAGTDRIASLQATRYPTRSYAIWANWNGSTVAFHRFFENAANRLYLENTGTSLLRFECTWSTAVGTWDVTMAAANTWHFIGLSYDDGATTNDPIIWLDSTKNTVGSGITETVTPAGTVTTSHASLTIGNRAAANRAWAGSLAEFAQWSVILTDDEFAALAKGMSPSQIRPQSLVECVPMLNDNISLKLGAPTITGATVGVHPRIYYPKRRYSYFTAPAGGTTFPITADAIAVATARLVRRANLPRSVGRVSVATLSAVLVRLITAAATAVRIPTLVRQGKLVVSTRRVGVATIAQQLVRIVTATATAVGVPSIVRKAFLNTPTSGARVSTLTRSANLLVSSTAAHTANLVRAGQLFVSTIAAHAATVALQQVNLISLSVTAVYRATLVRQAALVAAVGSVWSTALTLISSVPVVKFIGGARLAYHARRVRRPWRARERRLG
jgi:hypothetical protein